MGSKNIEDTYPLSPLQEGMLFHSLYDPGAGVYISQYTCTFRGLDVAAFESAWQKVVDRNSILRTAFVWEGLERPLQVVGRRVTPRLETQDWSGLSAGERDEAWQRFLRDDRTRGFKLSQAPVMRLTLIDFGDGAHKFVWAHHHLLLDGWSVRLVFKELLTFYGALSTGAHLETPPARPYRDYIAWLARQDRAAAERYWRDELKGFSAPTSLPGIERSCPRDGSEEDQGEIRSRLAAPVTNALRSLAKEHQLTLNTLVQGAWALLLSRYSEDDDIVLGVTLSGRPADLPHVESMVGLFINTLPVRLRLRPEEPLLAGLRQIQEQQAEMRQYEFSHLVEVHGWSDVPRGQRLFDTILAFENYPGGRLSDTGAVPLQIEEFRVFEKNSFSLALVVGPGEELSLRISYDLRRFDPASIERMLEHFRTLLTHVAADPRQRGADLRLLDDAQERQILVDWNATGADYPRDVCIHHLFDAQAGRTPDATAVELAGAHLSYLELRERTDRLAGRLRAAGVGPGTAVGLFLERSPEMIVALLGVLKAGGAYVPIDPDCPAARLRYILDDASPGVVLSQTSLAGRLADGAAQVLCLDGSTELRPAAESSGAEATAGDLAYILYTSGSTGRPKGVKVQHRALVNYVEWAKAAYLRGEGLGFALYSSLAFDLTVTSIFTPLVTGNRIVVYREGGLHLPEIVAAGGADVIKVTPSHLSLLGEMDCRRSRVRTIVVGGEAFDTGLARRIHESFGGKVEIFNEYGPTEAVVGCMIHRFDPERDLRSSVPIGRPAANTRIYILDAGLRPVPEHVAGELYIAGECLAQGYLNLDGLTAERFVQDPFMPGARMYRTGDLARRLPDGLLEFLGRRDSQVKLNGHRVELDEIRSLLNRHPKVRDSAVVVREGRAASLLVAYYASRQEIDSRELRSFLADWMSEATTPQIFVHLKKLPLTLNGKLNVEALPALDEAIERRQQLYVAPRTPTQEILAGIWSEVLGAGRLGAEDNFFALGGHSLLATQVISRVREAFQVELRLSALFSTPTIAGLAAVIDEARVSGDSRPELLVGTGPRSSEPPLSFAQERLWFLDRLEPQGSAYNLGFALRLRGDLDLGILERVRDEVVNRHEILRTTFPERKGRPCQLILPSMPSPLPVVDLQALDEPARSAEARRAAAREARRPFDLARGPLVRTLVLRLGAGEHVLLFSLHHIVTDAWSNGVLVREVAALYEAFRTGRPSPLPDLPVQYADYAEWQRRWLTGDVLEHQLAYWRGQLGADLPVVELPTDHPRSQPLAHRGARLRRRLPAGLTARLHELSRRSGTTLFMTLLGAFDVLLHRYTGLLDVPVGTPIAGRNRVEIEPLVGFFVNTLVLRTRLDGDPHFQEILRRVRETALAAYLHQDVPFGKLVEELRPERSLGRNPLFQVMFTLQNAAREELKLAGMELSGFEIAAEATKFDLNLILEEQADELAVLAEYDLGLFAPTTINRLLDHFQVLLENVAAHPGQRLAGIAMMTEAERHQALFEWNDTATSFPRERSIHELFEERAARSPDAVAVVFEGQELTCGELNRQANQLARRLRSLGIGPEDRVGIRLDRCLELIVAVLGVLKAGGAYLPLDPASPRERQALILADAKAPLLLTDRRQEHDLPETGIPVLDLDEARTELARESAENLPCVSLPDSLAYVMYTSGSTGMPKGVGIVHRGVVRLVRDTGYADYGSDQTFLLFAPVSFDASTPEIWGPLLNGGRLVVYPAETPSFAELGRVLAGHQVSFLGLTAGLFQQMVEHHLEGLGSVRQLIAGGDVVSIPHVRKALAGLPELRLIHAYGPTESTTFATTLSFDSAEQVGASLPIGRPIANTRVHLLDRDLLPAAVGVPAELFIGGDGLARGYVGRPDLTAERFVPAPVGEPAGSRLYRTGDLARYAPDGRIEFLGRTDHQVKVRGFRIELGEVESALAAHPGVREVVVVAREDVPGDKRLVAYLVPERPPGPGAQELRDFLQVRLPDYMVPSAFVLLDRLALTPHGKVDRRALPAPSQVRSDLEEGFRAPRTSVEELLAGIWEQVLRLERVGVEDDFFELGGHSLMATQVISRIREVFGIELPLRSMFEAPTVAGLAGRIEESLEEGATHEPIGRRIRERNLPLSYAQQRLWFVHQLDPRSAAFNMPVALRLEGPLDDGALERSLSEVVRRHESLRTVFEETDGGLIQVVHDPKPVRLPVSDLSRLADREGETRRLLEQETARPFDLTAGPLLRSSLLRLGPEEHVLLLTLHHIVSDGWSMGVLSGELMALYNSLSAGLPSPLPELPIQYADFALWQREHLAGERLDGHLAYWKRQLAGAPPHLDLRTDHPRPATRRFRGGSFQWTLPERLGAEIKALGRREGTTLFMTLLAAVDVLLHHRSGSEDVVVGTDIANRNRAETEGLIGFFVNQLVLRTDLSRDPSFRELLRRVREVTLGAYLHQDMPFDRLVEELGTRRDPGRSPLFQVELILQNLPPLPQRSGPLSAAPLPLRSRSSKLDLLFSVRDAAQGLSVLVEYDSDLFEVATVRRLARTFESILGLAVEHPDLPLSGIETRLDAAERERDADRARAAEEVRSKLFKTVRRRPVRLQDDAEATVPTGPHEGAMQ